MILGIFLVMGGDFNVVRSEDENIGYGFNRAVMADC